MYTVKLHTEWMFLTLTSDLDLCLDRCNTTPLDLFSLLIEGHVIDSLPVRIKEFWKKLINEPPHDKTNKMACAPSEDSDQPGHPPSLIRVFAVRMKKAGVLSYILSAQQRLWSDWADAQADLSIHWAHSHFVGFVMRRFKCVYSFSFHRVDWIFSEWHLSSRHLVFTQKL